MQCIFCHKDSSGSKSKEHIIPESLGNKEHFLPIGYVCDECNHYFAVKIEKPLLSLNYFKGIRDRKHILTKKNKTAKQTFFFPQAVDTSEIADANTPKGKVLIIDNPDVYNGIINGKINTMYVPYYPEPDYPDPLLSRFLAKCAYEYFLYHVKPDKYESCAKELLSEQTDVLKPLREYARYGKGPLWQYNQRMIYQEGSIFYTAVEKLSYEILHEMTMFTKEHTISKEGLVEAEIYFVVAICGIEYAICISDPDISGYRDWLANNNNRSPLKEDYETITPCGLSYNKSSFDKNKEYN